MHDYNNIDETRNRKRIIYIYIVKRSVYEIIIINRERDKLSKQRIILTILSLTRYVNTDISIALPIDKY